MKWFLKGLSFSTKSQVVQTLSCWHLRTAQCRSKPCSLCRECAAASWDPWPWNQVHDSRDENIAAFPKKIDHSAILRGLPNFLTALWGKSNAIKHFQDCLQISPNCSWQASPWDTGTVFKKLLTNPLGPWQNALTGPILLGQSKVNDVDLVGLLSQSD